MKTKQLVKAILYICLHYCFPLRLIHLAQQIEIRIQFGSFVVCFWHISVNLQEFINLLFSVHAFQVKSSLTRMLFRLFKNLVTREQEDTFSRPIELLHQLPHKVSALPLEVLLFYFQIESEQKLCNNCACFQATDSPSSEQRHI